MLPSHHFGRWYFGLRYKRRGKTVLVEKQFPKTKWVSSG